MNVYIRGMTNRLFIQGILRTGLFLPALFVFASLWAQPPKTRSAHSGEIRTKMEHLGSFVSVLYVAAHPDDENTRMLAWLSRDRGYRTAYLSLTRGDGGQNLIGSEQGIELGGIRTQELLEARHRDGAEQYFSSAYDFGFSKNPEETFSIWNREKILEETVWLIRNLKPDIIITRFSPEPGPTHGHHTASAMIALEAFRAAADPEKFPEQLRQTDVWQTKRILWNTSWFFFGTRDYDKTGLVKLDMGSFLPLLGQSVGEIAAESRSCHRSQGFGSARQRGEEIEYLKHLDGEPINTEGENHELTEGLETGWRRLPGSEKAEAVFKRLLAKWKPEQPDASIPALLELRRELKKLPISYWRNHKIQKTEELIADCLGWFGEVLIQSPEIIPGDSVKAKIELISRSRQPFTVGRIFRNSEVIAENIRPEYNKIKTLRADFKASADIKPTHPFWAEKRPENGMLSAGNPESAIRPWNPLTFKFYAELFVLNDPDPVSVEIPFVYKYTEPDQGEMFKPVAVVSEISLNPTKTLCLLKPGETKTAVIKVISHSDAQKNGVLEFDIRGNLRVIPARTEISLKGKNTEFELTVSISGDSGTIVPRFIRNGSQSSASYRKISYPHIPGFVMQDEASIQVKQVRVNNNPKLRIGYVNGAGDEVCGILRELGYNPRILEDEDLRAEVLSGLDVVILGVRAYNTRNALDLKRKELMDFVFNGGRLVVQYNTSGNLSGDPSGPFPFKISRNRITEEHTPLKILNPGHMVFQRPHIISSTDFDGWIQERGLYFLSDLAPEYSDLLEGNDRGEEARRGILVHAPYGKGHYFYTGLSFFRQLPYGHEGAIRLFVNLLESSPEPQNTKKPKR